MTFRVNQGHRAIVTMADSKSYVVYHMASLSMILKDP